MDKLKPETTEDLQTIARDKYREFMAEHENPTTHTIEALNRYFYQYGWDAGRKFGHKEGRREWPIYVGIGVVISFFASFYFVFLTLALLLRYLAA